MTGTTTLAFELSSTENRSWGTAPDDAPPSFAPPRGVRFPASTASIVTIDASASTVAPGAARTVRAVVTNRDATATTIAWHATVSSPATLAPSSGSVTLAPGASANLDLTLTLGPSAPAGLYGVTIDASTASNALLQPASLAVRVTRDGEITPLAWIENRFNDTVVPFDLRTNTYGPPVAVGGGPRDAVLSSDNRRLYVADRDTQSVSVVDTLTAKVVATVKVGNSPNGIALAPNGLVWVANFDDGTVQAIDPKTLVAGRAIAVGSGPRYIAIDAKGTHLYVTCQTDNSVSVVDLNTFATSTLPAGARPTGISLGAGGKTAYVANNGDRTVSVIDLASGRIVASIPAGPETQAIAIAPDGASAYVSNFMGNTVTLVNLRDNTAVRSIVVGGQPFDVRFTPQGDLLTILHRDNALVRFDPSGKITANVFLGSGGAYSIALPH
jgi:YVTN family beta-propeller protein